MNEVLIGVMDLQEAKNHQYSLRAKGVELELRSNPKTCSTGSCKVTVEVWGSESDVALIQQHFQSDYLKHVKGHEPDFEALSSVFDPTKEMVVCQACGTKFSPQMTECPDCGLCYG